MVVKRGTNEHEILPMARHFRGTASCCASSNTWTWVPATAGAWTKSCPRTPCASGSPRIPLIPLAPAAPGETAERWGYADGAGEVGFISSVTQAFCGDCNRARLSTEGKLYLCLFASNGYDLRSLVRGGASDEELASAIGHIWQGRTDRYSELRGTLAAELAPAAAAWR